MDNKEAVKRLLLLLDRYRKTIIVIVGCLFIAIELNLCILRISTRNINDTVVCLSLIHISEPTRPY